MRSNISRTQCLAEASPYISLLKRVKPAYVRLQLRVRSRNALSGMPLIAG